MVNTPEKFWRRCDQSGGPDSCWEWQGARTPTTRPPHLRYGFLSWQGKNANAQRVAFEIVNGPIPAGMVVRHKCDNPPCCNPAHLEIGTHADNTRDMHERKRSRAHGGVTGQRYQNPPTPPRDQLIATHYDEIHRATAAGESPRLIANRLGISDSTVRNALRRWRPKSAA